MKIVFISILVTCLSVLVTNYLGILGIVLNFVLFLILFLLIDYLIKES